VRRLVALAVVASVCVVLVSVPVLSADTIHLVVNRVEVYPDVPPLLVDGRVLVPIRVISENLGYDVFWHADVRTVTVDSPGQSHPIPPLSPGDVHLVINGVEGHPDVPPRIVDGRVMVPIRFVSEAFYLDVEWLQQARAVSVGQQGRLLEVHFIAVGQGDCTLVKLSCGETMLVDGGDDAHAGDVLAYLQTQGVTSLNYVIATHPDPEHVGGLDEVVEALPVGTVILSDQAAQSEVCAELMAAIQDKGVASRPPFRLECLVQEHDTTVCLYGPKKAYDNVDDGSIVVEIWNGSIIVALMGDRETQGVEDLLGTGEFCYADVLRVGDHGSDTSSTAKLTAPNSPRYAVISVGATNESGFPAQSTLQTLDAVGATVYRTDLNGTVVAFATEQSVWLVTEIAP